MQDGWAERGIGSKVNSRLTIPCLDAGSVGTVFFFGTVCTVLRGMELPPLPPPVTVYVLVV